MLRSIKQLYGNKLAATDGEIGQVKDVYFDDVHWTVRYVVAETGTWLTSRQVLLSPHALGNIQRSEHHLEVRLTRQQIEKSPSIEWHKPVSRQFEEEYHRYFGWPYYWEGNGLWGGMRSFPILETPGNSSPKEQTTMAEQKAPPDAHLRSTQAVKGYHLQASDGIIGHIADFLMDPKSWAIKTLVIKTGHRFSGNEVELPTGAIQRISWKDSTVFTSLTGSQVEQSPAHLLALNGATVPVRTDHRP